MKILRNFAVISALMVMPLMQIFAQNSEKKVNCRDLDCVLNIMYNLDSDNDSLVAEAEQDVAILTDNANRMSDRVFKNDIKKAIIIFVGKYENCGSNEYLMSLLPKVCDKKDANEIIQRFENGKFADNAIRAVGDIPETEEIIVQYIADNHDNLQHKAALAYAVGKQNIVIMEDEIISWLKGADDKTKIEVYKALMIIGSNEKSFAIVKKGAKKLYKSKDVDVKIAAMELMVATQGEKTMPKLYKAFKNNDKRVRVAALDLMKPYANDKTCVKVVKACKNDEQISEVLNWLGEIKNESQMTFVIAQLSSNNPKVVEAAIRAVFNIDNPVGIAAVKPMFGGKYQEVIKEEMVKYDGDYFSVLNDVIKGNDQQQLAALQIIEERPILETNRRVRELLDSNNPEIRDEAYKALKYVVMPANAEFLSALLENCDDVYVNDVQLAIKNAMAKAPESAKDKFAGTLKHVKPEIMPRFYKVFAYFGTEMTINKLIDAYNTGEYKDEAREALLLAYGGAYKEKIDEVLKH